MERVIVFSGYAQKDEDSIYQYVLDTDTGKLWRKGSFCGVENPSWVLMHPDGKIMYAVEELQPEGRVAVLRVNGGELEHLYSVSSGGVEPCHLSMDPEARFLFAANYSSGSLAVYRVDEEGNILEMSDLVQREGHGVHPERQECAHVHFSTYIKDCLYICDLGTDCVVKYRLDSRSGKLQQEAEIVLSAGAGPRHILTLKHKSEMMYVVAELTSDVYVLEEIAGVYEIKQCISSRKDKEECQQGRNIAVVNDTTQKVVDAAREDIDVSQKVVDVTAAAIKTDAEEKYLYVSNRGCEEITVFEILEDGGLRKVQVISCEGVGPRDIEVIDQWLLAANQYSGEITTFTIDRLDGTLTYYSREKLQNKPVCIVKL